MRVIVLISICFFVLTSPSAQAQSWATGNDVKEACHSDSYHDRGYCLGFAIAIAAVVTRPFGPWKACYPTGVTAGQLRDVMVKFLDDHPELLHVNATSLPARAYTEAFPCVD